MGFFNLSQNFVYRFVTFFWQFCDFLSFSQQYHFLRIKFSLVRMVVKKAKKFIIAKTTDNAVNWKESGMM